VRELKPCPFCGSELLTIDCAEYFEISCAGKDCIAKTYDSKQAALEHWNTRAGSIEIDRLREQVKVLRAALGWLVNEMDCRDDEFGGCLFTRQDFKIARDVLEQTKPKDGE